MLIEFPSYNKTTVSFSFYSLRKSLFLIHSELHTYWFHSHVRALVSFPVDAHFSPFFSSCISFCTYSSILIFSLKRHSHVFKYSPQHSALTHPDYIIFAFSIPNTNLTSHYLILSFCSHLPLPRPFEIQSYGTTFRKLPNSGLTKIWLVIFTVVPIFCSSPLPDQLVCIVKNMCLYTHTYVVFHDFRA